MISLIAAFANDPDGKLVIGSNNSIPWHLPEDLSWFKNHTMYKTLVMGRKTFESIPTPPVKNRKIIILTKNKDYTPNITHNSISVQHDYLDLVERFVVSDENLVVCGGEGVYKQFLPWASSVLLTEIHTTVVGDTYLPFTPEQLVADHMFNLVMLEKNERKFRETVLTLEWTYRLYTRRVEPDGACP